MYYGYARGFARSRGDIVVFSHDDIRFAVEDFSARLADAMATADVVGVAGTTRVSGPALLWSGHPYLFGTITHKAPTDPNYEFAVISLAGPRITGAQGLDGVFIAARRTLIERVGFDTAGIHGFHFYDIDFRYRAYTAGARLTMALHYSGRFWAPPLQHLLDHEIALAKPRLAALAQGGVAAP